MDDGLDKIIEGSGVRFVVGSQELEGNFDLIQENGLVRLSMEKASVVVGDDSNDYIKVLDVKGTALIDPEGVAIDAKGNAEMLLSNLSTSGEYRVKIKTFDRQIAQQFLDQSTIFIRAGPVTEVSGTGVTLTVAGQMLTGNFNFSKTESIGMDLILDLSLIHI